MNVQQTSQQFHQNATQPAYQEAPQGAVAQATQATQAVDVPRDQGDRAVCRVHVLSVGTFFDSIASCSSFLGTRPALVPD